MLAVVAERIGAPEVLVPAELPDPQPGAGQVLVRVEASSVTFVETQMRAGTGPMPIPAEDFPLVLGNGVGGTVRAVGPDVDPSWTGRRVVTATGGRGGYATLALAAADDLHTVPPGLSTTDATALLADGRTALGLVRAAEVGPGDVVLVSAAAGGVGGLLVQLCRGAGARVVGLAGGEVKRAHAAGLGAASTVDSTAPDRARLLREVTPGGVTVAFDGVGGATSAVLAGAVRRGGRYVAYGIASGSPGDVDPDELAERSVTTVTLGARVFGGASGMFALVEDVLAMAAEGRVRAVVGQSFPLHRAADAHRAMESRSTTGKTLLTASGA